MTKTTETEASDLIRQESRLRGRAKRMGYRMCRSREWKHVPNVDNMGEFMLTNDRNWIVLGARYDATLDEIEAFLAAENEATLDVVLDDMKGAEG